MEEEINPHDKEENVAQLQRSPKGIKKKFGVILPE